VKPKRRLQTSNVKSEMKRKELAELESMLSSARADLATSKSIDATRD